MCVPDMALIVEIMLMSEGFNMSKMLSRKFVILYRLCEDLLSKSKHYDWKLRAIKTTLYVAGGMKRSAPDLSEDKVTPCLTHGLLYVHIVRQCIASYMPYSHCSNVSCMKSVCIHAAEKSQAVHLKCGHGIKHGCCSGVVASSEGLQPGQADSR